MLVFFADTTTDNTGNELELTILTDIQIYSKDVSSMCHYQYRPSFTIPAFRDHLQKGKIKIVGNIMFISIGSYHVYMKQPGNVGKQLGRLVIEIQELKSGVPVAFYVCGVIPWPKDEDEYRRAIMKTNTSISAEMRSLIKFWT